MQFWIVVQKLLPDRYAISLCLNRHNYAAIMDFFQNMLFLCFFVMLVIIWYEKVENYFSFELLWLLRILVNFP